jgi:hypothetical protein
MEIIGEGKFVKKRLKPIMAYGQFRGPGRIVLSDGGIRIQGKHVYSLGARWGFGLLVWFGVAIVSAGTLIPGILLIYPIVEYWWLKKETLDLPYSSVKAVVTDEGKQLVAFDFEGSRWCTPAVLRSPDWRTLAEGMRTRVPSVVA